MDFIENQAIQYPQYAEQYAELGKLYSRKLWHQLTSQISTFIKVILAAKGTDVNPPNLAEFYTQFLSKIEFRMNQLSVALIKVLIAEHFPDTNDAITFLMEMIPIAEAKVEKVGVEAIAYMKIHILIQQLRLATPDLAACKEELALRKEEVDALGSAEAVVHSSLHYAAKEFHKVAGPAADFYSSALLYISYSDLSTLSAEDTYALATDISLAALTGENVFNFGEVLCTPILSCLAGTPNAWLGEVMEAFHVGDVDKFNKVIGDNMSAFQAQPALSHASEYIKEKISLLCLLQLVFKRPSHQRTLSFGDIAAGTRLPLNQVEWLVMRAMSLDLMKGSIDQVDQKVHVTYIKPRVLDNTQISDLAVRLKDWGVKVRETLVMMEDQTPELFV